MKNRILQGGVILVACIMVVSAVGVAVAAEKPIKWRMANWGPRLPDLSVLYEGFVNDVKEASGGRLIIENVYDGEGIPGDQVLGAVETGLVEMGAPFVPYHVGELKAGTVETGLPGLTTTMEEQQMLIDKRGWKEVLRKAYAEKNLYWLGIYSTPPTYMITKNPINSVDDLKKMKIRCAGAIAKFMRKLGASTITTPFTEAYMGFATGVYQGMAGNPIVDIWDGKFYEVGKYLYPQIITGGLNQEIIINMDKWNSLPNDLKAILEISLAKFTLDNKVGMTELAYKHLKNMSAVGLKMSPEPSDAGQKEMEESCA